MSGVSVVLAVRNGAQTLPPTLAGILEGQEFLSEVILVEDGSSDETPSIAARASELDPRIKVIAGEGRGLTRALILGCAAARGEFIARQDCGDRSLAGRFGAQARELLADEKIGFVSCHTRFLAPGGEELEVSDGGCSGGGVAEVRSGFGGRHPIGPSHHGSVMFRRDLYESVGGYREAFRYAQDWDLWLRMAERAKFAMIPRVLYEAAVDPDGISMAKAGEQRAFARLAEDARLLRAGGRDDAELLAAGPGAVPITNRKPAGDYFIGSVLLRRGDPAAAKYLWRAVARNPWYPPAWLKAGLASARGAFRK